MKTTQEMIEIMQASVEGKEIEERSPPLMGWKTKTDDVWLWGINDYRIKPPHPRNFWVVIDITTGEPVNIYPHKLPDDEIDAHESLMHVREVIDEDST